MATPRQRERPETPQARKQRRALSHVGGKTELEGDPKAAASLAAALDVPTSAQAEDAARAHVHGFHSYPARMHPLSARRLIEELSQKGERVLDPFCGSGTVLVEARLLGREAVGVDANPLAVRLARLKARGSTPEERERLIAYANEAAALADERREARSGPSRRYGPADMALFATHVLLELDGLRLGIDRIPDERARADLELVLSSILIKISRRASDTAGREEPRRIAAGYPARLFVKKTEELTRRLAEIEAPLAAAPPPLVLEGDARQLTGVADGSVALVVTSPPYPGVYDYLEHHEARLRWLRLRSDRFSEAEIGARRSLDPLGPDEGLARWKRDLGGVLRALHRVMRPRARAVLLLADSVVAGEPVFAADLLKSGAPRFGFEVRALASQERPHFHGPTARAFARRPRREHAILLERSPSSERATPRGRGASR
ncbi:MAG: site-specific DNA-methyltransferase [Polyangiaceae bacterium]|nr:site-specific DNA-methyltransferase [Polyangiaceae bacterium]